MSWICPRCNKSHDAELFEFVHIVNRFGRSLGRINPPEPATVGEFFAKYGDAVQVETLEKGRYPAPWLFMAPLDEARSIIGVIPLDEYLHEQMYPMDLEDGRGTWMTSDGKRWNAGTAAVEFERALPTPISDLMLRRDDPRAWPESVLRTLVTAADPAVWGPLQIAMRKTAADEKVPWPFPWTDDGGDSYHFSDGKKLTVPEILWQHERAARERRKATILEKSLRDAAAKG